MYVDRTKTYVGIVEDNEDPKKLGRCRVRVLDIFDEIPVSDIPWATSWKDLNGNEFNVPEKGKVVTVIFEQGNIYKPEYIYADHYNINLESKLNSLSGTNYTSMKSLIFDHKTQIYVNDDEGLKLDHKYNNINITEGSVNINLKDNNGLVNIGDATAAQQAILGNHWMDWFDEFVDNLLGTYAGPFLGNMGSPVVPNPSFIEVLQKYKALRDPVFLSHHVNIVDNDKVSTVRTTKREDNSQVGDTWKSTIRKNDVTIKTADNFKPVDGPKQPYDPTYVPPATNGQPDTAPNTSDVIPPADPLSSTTSNPTIDKLVRFLKSKSYHVYDTVGLLNIVGMRGARKDGGTITNKFDDNLYVFYKNSSGNWELMLYTITTTPGFKPKTSTLPDKVAILTPGQYVDQYKLGFHQGKSDHKCLKFATSVVNRNDNSTQYDYSAITSKGSFGINIHRSNPNGSAENVFNWSEGCIVFKNINQFKQFISLCENQESIANKGTFTFTLCRQSEFDAFS
jgi:hypothetical protein